MKISEVIPEILGIVNNKTYSQTTLYNWIKATLLEIKMRQRWEYLTVNMIQNLDTTNKFLPYPTILAGAPPAPVRYLHEIQEPIVLSTLQYGIEAQNGVWTVPTIMWEFEKENCLFSYKGDFRLSDLFGIEFNTRWNTTPSAIWLRFYREMVIPTSYSDATTDLDLPDEFVFKLMTFGPSRMGLIQEDDYDRYKIVSGEFEKAMKDMTEWDSRRRNANGMRILRNHNINTFGSGPLMPGNYSLR